MGLRTRIALGIGLVFALGACASGSGDRKLTRAAPTTSTSESTTTTAIVPTTVGPTSTLATVVATTLAPPTTTTAPPPPRRRTQVPGFGEIAFRVARYDVGRCALLASTPEQRRQGMMGRTDFAGYDGMLFVYSEDHDGGFWMKDTPIPLSIAYFDSSGRFVSSADMEPCMNRGNDCPVYRADGPYRMALEVPQGGLSGLGIGPGAVMGAGGSCAG